MRGHGEGEGGPGETRVGYTCRGEVQAEETQWGTLVRLMDPGPRLSLNPCCTLTGGNWGPT